MIPRTSTIICAALAAVFLAAGIAWSQAGTPVQVSTKEGVGSYLTDAKGRALYIFKKDTPGKSVCTGGCLEKWPVFFAEKLTASAGVNEKDFGVMTREDGKKQTTFKGMPLYYFANDKLPGDTNGQGINTVWYVVDPATFQP